MARKPITVCFPFVGDTIGGSHLSALTLLQSLDRERFRPLVVVHEEGPFTAYLRDVGLSYRLLPVPRYVGRDSSPVGHVAALVAILPKLVWFLRRERIDAVHTNDGRMHLTWTLPAWLAGKRLIWHQRNRVSDSRLQALMLRLATRVIAISRFAAQGLPPHADAKTSVLANPITPSKGLDRARSKAALLRELALTDETRVIGLFGNLIAWKRPLLFVEAAARLAQDSGQSLAFVVFGDDREGLQAVMTARASQLGIDGRLFFMGFRTPVASWMAACDVLVAPAEGEPFGRTLVEAMLCGTAVVASESGGHREIVESGRNGLLVPGDDPAAYAAAVARLLDDADLRERIARQAHQSARSRYDPARHAVAVMTLYDESLGRSKGEASAIASSEDSGVVLVIADLGCGGAQRVLTRLARAWAEAGRVVTVVTLADVDTDFFSLPQAVRRVALGLQRPSKGLAGAVWANLRRIPALRRTIRSSRSGTVLSFVAGTNILTILATRGLGCRVVISERNDPARQSLGQPWDWLRRRLYRFADCVTANSVSAIATLRDSVPEDKLTYVPNPLDLPERVPENAAREPVVLAVGRLDRQKGFDVLLKAFGLCQARHDGWRLAILGDGPLRAELQVQAKTLGLDNVVEWRALTPDPTAHYRQAGLFVLPSRHEGTSNALLEAMAHAMPVIVTESSGGAMELVRDGVNGLVVPAEDAAALARAIDDLTADVGLRQRIGAAARNAVERCGPDDGLAPWNAALQFT